MFMFILIVLSIYALINGYIFRRGWQALAGHPRARLVLSVVFLAAAASFFAARLFIRLGWNGAAGPTARAGALYLALMLYLLMGVVLVDLFRIADGLFRIFPETVRSSPFFSGRALLAYVAGASILIIIGGAINAGHPHVREFAVCIDKPAAGRRTLTAVMASDLHLGLVSGPGRLKPLVDRINSLAPDVVFLPGDIVDESVTPRVEEEMVSTFEELRPPLGVYFVPGNHETYSGLERNLAFIRKCGIIVLQDEAVDVGGVFWLVGRRDFSSLARGEKRMPLATIMSTAGVDRARPVILLDHQPLRLDEAREAGIDLQLSGHTHAGQLFPLNLINKRLYEQNWGYLRKGGTQYYVSCGVGTWGPPVRTGSTPEIMKITLTFGQDR